MSQSDPIPQTPSAKLVFDDRQNDELNSDQMLNGGGRLALKQDKTEAEVPGLLDPSAFRRFSTSPFSQSGRFSPLSFRDPSPAPVSRTRQKTGFRGWLQRFWDKNAGPIQVAVAQMFAALMNLSARLLELDEENPMHPMQVLFARMVLTLLACSIFMWWQKIPDAPFGPKGVRLALVARGVAGFFGIYGMWYSVMYLPLAEATVISFLAPNLAGYMCHVLLHEPFTRTEQMASFLALGGVVLITRPLSFFTGLGEDNTTSAVVEVIANATIIAGRDADPDNAVTTAERLKAVGVGLIGVMGAATVFTILRWIGKRAHPLHSVNYFSTWCIIVSGSALSIAPAIDFDQPDLHFALPHSLRQWLLLLLVGVCGFWLQFLLSAGLAREKSNRATAMIYTHMLFAAAFDRWIFGHSMGWVSLTGCGCIVGSALWVALAKNEGPATTSGNNQADIENGHLASLGNSEAVPMLRDMDGSDMDDDDDEVMLDRIR